MQIMFFHFVMTAFVCRLFFLLFILFRTLFDFLMKILIFNNAQIKKGHV